MGYTKRILDELNTFIKKDISSSTLESISKELKPKPYLRMSVKNFIEDINDQLSNYRRNIESIILSDGITDEEIKTECSEKFISIYKYFKDEQIVSIDVMYSLSDYFYIDVKIKRLSGKIEELDYFHPLLISIVKYISKEKSSIILLFSISQDEDLKLRLKYNYKIRGVSSNGEAILFNPDKMI